MSRLNFIEAEEEILKFWKDNSIYKKAKDKNKNKQKFYFLDGPPYTSGKVHIGTAWNKSLKDAILRYKRMAGFDVWDRAGYDMHGLPTENATQKKLGIKTKKEIMKLGVDKFIEECKNLCVENLEAMNDDFKRLGVWMDFDNAYQSIDKDFMNGEWWLIKRAYEEGRLYQGLRTMTWCPNSESALAKHELEYKTVVDTSIFVKLKINNDKNEYLVIWTTTPWTIPFNLAVMVNPEVDYLKIKVEDTDETWIVAAPLVGVFMGGVADKKYKVVEELKGEQLEGIEYVHPFYDELKEHYDKIKKDAPKTHTVLLSKEYVDTSGGSGLVHCAPGCGPEDYEVGHKNGIPPFNTIDTKGVFPETMGKFSGLKAKKDDNKFIESLKDVNALIATTDVEHEYPHDWRYHEPVVFRTTKQWFFKIEDLKEKMINFNNEVNWVPETAFNAFDSWLKNLRDNSISKQRFWGTPIPVWVNEKDDSDFIVVGSSDELEELSGQKVDDLHIPTVDKIKIEKEGKIYKRIPDILDVWVDAGTVSWNCLYYPKQKDKFEKLFPADFILEGKDQIRGWFNLLMVASTIALDKPSFKNVYMHGFVQDAQGRKMSKSLGNYILPSEVIEKYGSETLRYYMIGGANPGLDINYNFDDMVVETRNLGVLSNVVKFLTNLSDTVPKNPKLGIEEKYILSKLNSTIKIVTEKFDLYKINEIPQIIEDLYLELSRTYIQFVREKINSGTKEEKEACVYTIFKVIFETLKLFAPICPMITEDLYLKLKENFSLEKESIHLYDYPKVDENLLDNELEKEIGIIKNIIAAGLNAREKISLGVRWPLPEIVIETKDDNVFKAIKNYSDLIKNQLNIENISLEKLEMKINVKPNYKKIGPD
ncbi:MAG: isoleucine--tRNA ligase, partial [Minisyncoccales bacterium]